MSCHSTLQKWQLAYLPIDITQVEVNGKLPILCLAKLAKRGSPVLSSYRGLLEKSYAGTRLEKAGPRKKDWKHPFNFDRWHTLHSLPE